MEEVTKYNAANKTKKSGCGCLVALLIFLMLTPIGWIALPIIIVFAIADKFGEQKGTLKAKATIRKENKALKNINPYIYCRELPNDFGIGVTSILFDSTIENKKDIIAVILDLCAKKYFKLEKNENKYIITIINDDEGQLLENERYIYNLVKNNELTKIDYNNWYKLCLEDGINLGIYKPVNKKIELNKIHQKNNNEESKKVKIRTIIIVIICLITALYTYNSYKELEKNDYRDLIINNNQYFGEISNFDKIRFIVQKGIACSLTLFLISGAVAYVCGMIKALISVANDSYLIAYEEEMKKYLQRTKKGIEELQKLYAFKAFIRDFGNFVDKKPEEVVIWDRYLSYAQVFGLTTEIMQTGYKELIQNASFKIDSIDNIEFSNIEIEK